MEWLDNVAGPGYTSALLWTFAALILLVIVLVIIKLVRSLNFGTFVAGGRNRKTRLAVMDATAVDSHRRLILVRRDDIEHLLLIGGPTDLVIERDIRLTQQRRPSLEGNHEQPPRPRALDQQPTPRPAPQPRAPEPAPMQRPAAAPQPPVRPAMQAYAPQPAPAAAHPPIPPLAAQPMPPRPAPAPAPRPEPLLPLSAPIPAPVRQEPIVSAPAPQAPSPAPEPALPSPQHDEIDESLLKELDVAFGDSDQGKAPEVSLDDEMAKLLGELSSQKR